MTPNAGRTLETVAEEQTRCGLCGSGLERCAEPLTSTPAPTVCQLPGKEAAYLPLLFCVCPGCGHVQLGTVIDRHVALGRALNADGLDAGRRRAAASFAEFVLQRIEAPHDALVVEVGCNDGTLLDIFDDKGFRVQGLEPAINVAGIAMAKEYPTHVGLLTPAIAERLVDERGFADILIARDALAQTENPAAFTLGAKALLKPDGAFVFEVPLIHEIVRLTTLEGVSHQNCHYFVPQSLRRFFDACDMAVTYLSPVEGQARLRGIARPAPDEGASPYSLGAITGTVMEGAPDAMVQRAALEEALARIAARARSVADGLREEVAAGRSVAALGLDADAVTFLHLGRLDGAVISAIYSPFEDLGGMMAPGTDIPIRDLDALDAAPPDHLLLLDWRFADQAQDACKAVLQRGGRVTSPFH